MHKRFCSFAGTALFLMILLLASQVMAAEDYTGLQYAYGDQGMQVPDWNQPGNVNAGGCVVAILDTGIDVGHPDLKDVLWQDGRRYPQLIPFGGGDYGISVADSERERSDVSDLNGHGTHVAGIVGAAWNGFGVSGGANGVRLMTVQTGAEEDPTYDAEIAGLKYVLAAKKAGVPIVAVNISWGGSLIEINGGPELNDLVRQLGEAGVVTVFAAGNGGINLDYSNHVSLWLRTNPYALIVGNATREREPSENSQYSEKVVHVFAPGSDILSTVPRDWKGTDEENDPAAENEEGNAAGNTSNENPWKPGDPDYAYALMEGTSMAAPAVAAMVAVVAGKYRNEPADRLAARIVGTARAEPSLEGKCISGGIASVRNALSQAPVPVPQQAFCEGNRIQILGHFFGAEEGTLTLDGHAAQILSWSDVAITAVAPSVFNGRECRVSVRARDGKTGSRIMDFTGTFGKLEEVVPDGLRMLTHIRVADMVAFQGKLYVAGNNEHVNGGAQMEGQLYCIDPEAGTCRHVSTFPFLITRMCALEDQLVMISNGSLIFVSADGRIQRQVEGEPYQPFMAAQVGHELVVLCILEGEPKLCVFRGSGLTPVCGLEGICKDLNELTDVTGYGESAYFLYRNGGVLQVSETLQTSMHRLPAAEETHATLSVADGIPWTGLSDENNVLMLCPAENWAVQRSKGYVPSSELFLLPHTEVLGDYLYLIGLTPSLRMNLVLRRIRIREETQDAVEMPPTGDRVPAQNFAVALALSLSALWVLGRHR